VYELLCRLLRQKVSDFGNASKVHVRYLADTTDVLLKGHTLVEYDTEITHVCAGCDLGITNLNVWDRNFVLKVRRGNYYEFCFVSVEFQEIVLHPCLEVTQAVC
jgi:hypothetical protein